MIVTGVLIGLSFGKIFDSFRDMAGVCVAFPVIFAILMFFNKESPYYLLSKSRIDDAKASLEHFRGTLTDCYYAAV